MSETETPNPDDFSRNERERDYEARVSIRGTITIAVQADSAEGAQQQVDAELAKIEAEGFVQLDDIDEIGDAQVTKERPMFRVLREGRVMQVTHLQAGDLPRQPNEHGF